MVTSLCGRPAAEKIGIFCPRAMEFMVSIVEIPVCIISSGYIREYGLIGEPELNLVGGPDVKVAENTHR